MATQQELSWPLAQASPQRVAQLRAECRQLVRRRALLSAGVAALPVPGLDVLSDLHLFTRLIDDINQTFGLTPAQIAGLQPEYRMLAYEAAVGVGGMLVGKLITRDLLLPLLQRSGVKLLARQAGKLVPLAGQLASAGIGFAVFRHIGNQHVEACAAVAQQLVTAGAGRSSA